MPFPPELRQWWVSMFSIFVIIMEYDYYHGYKYLHMNDRQMHLYIGVDKYIRSVL